LYAHFDLVMMADKGHGADKAKDAWRRRGDLFRLV
jgi:hypothetical protein